MRALVTVDLGFGDAGKGSIVDYFSGSADIVVRYNGGSQCGHNVETTDGVRHTFSQFGSGTFRGVPTYLGPKVIVNPISLHKEAASLINKGIHNPWDFIFVDPRCLVTTIFHQCLNAIRERANKHGSCGHGIGETRHYWLKHGNDAIFLKDLMFPAKGLQEKLELLKFRCLNELEKIEAESGSTGFNQILKEYEFKSIPTLGVVKKFLETTRNLKTFTPQEMGLKRDFVVFEGAQGVLLDEWAGFHPNTTWSTTTPDHAIEMCQEWGVSEIFTLGITRIHTTRHGNGVLPTYSKDLTHDFPDPGNPTNKWQGDFRVGHLDFPLLKYAKQTLGVPLDGIAVNHLDQLDANYKICPHYSTMDTLEYSGVQSLRTQAGLRMYLEKVTPTYRKMQEPELLDTLGTVAPVKMVGRGPKGSDKRVLTPLEFRSLNSL